MNNSERYLTIENGVVVGCKWDAPEIVIPEGVTKIGKGAFYGCFRLSSITIPDSVTEIEDTAFVNEFIVDQNNPCFSSADGVLYSRDKKKLLCYPPKKKESFFEIPNVVTEVESFAFNGCDLLESVKIPDSVTEIGASFYCCKNLREITVEKNNPSYISADGVLYSKNMEELYCYPAGKSESSFDVPDSVRGIIMGAFGCCTLKSVKIPNGVTDIGDGAFRNCGGFETVALPEGINKIGAGTFFGCDNLETVVIPDSVTEIGTSAFASCHSLRSLAIPDSVVKIEDEAFCNCGIEVFNIPDGVTELGEGVFGFCNDLRELTVGENNPYYTAIDGVLYSRDMKKLLSYPARKDGSSFKIPDSVTEIGSGAFSVNENLESITIPNGVTEIGAFAFGNCKRLLSVEIPDSVTKIGEDAFAECKELEFVKLSESLTAIEGGTFSDCLYLRSLAIPEGVTEIGASAFDHCDHLESITLPGSLVKIGEDAFYHCEILQSLTIPDGVTEINPSIFGRCDCLSKIVYKGKEYKGVGEFFRELGIEPDYDPNRFGYDLAISVDPDMLDDNDELPVDFDDDDFDDDPDE